MSRQEKHRSKELSRKPVILTLFYERSGPDSPLILISRTEAVDGELVAYGASFPAYYAFDDYSSWFNPAMSLYLTYPKMRYIQFVYIPTWDPP